MGKWTKGPWTMKRGEVCAWDEEEKSVIPLASVYRSEAYCQGFAPESEDQHNAILMAAAPEMYEAMQEFVDRCEAGIILSQKTYVKFKAILAKARGEKA